MDLPGTPRHEPDPPPADPGGDGTNGLEPEESSADALGPAEPDASEPGEPDAPPAELRASEPGAAATGRPTIEDRMRRVFRMPRSRAGIFALLLVLGGAGLAAVFTGVSLVTWTETADFCGRCHSMEPELAAYERGSHRSVTCGECHVEPGVAGWIKAKLNGTRQLAELVLGIYPTPIPPPDHADLPSAEDTCMHCHNTQRFALASLKTRTLFSEDEANTRQFVGLLVRPGSGDVFDVDRSVHWHVLRDVRYRTPDEESDAIGYVVAQDADGGILEFIGQNEITVVDDVTPDIARIVESEIERKMSCYDCHNRTGHAITNPRREMDFDLSRGAIDVTLPYVKREGMRILWAEHETIEDADAAAERLTDFYELFYPEIAESKAEEISQAIERIKFLYRLSATPEMRVTASTYPDHLGHTDYPGCFRCHDGGHFLVVDGVATTRTIPSTCDTCHTFPQIGPAVASLPLGQPPETHDDVLFMFNHKNFTTEIDPGGQTCGECHARDFCVNCHSTGAITVNHDEMLFDHAAVIRESGNRACAYCHQPIYCARCHAEPVLPDSAPPNRGGATGEGETGGVPAAPPGPPGLDWPLVPSG
jgi:hypothetical protein